MLNLSPCFGFTLKWPGIQPPLAPFLALFSSLGLQDALFWFSFTLLVSAQPLLLGPHLLHLHLGGSLAPVLFDSLSSSVNSASLGFRKHLEAGKSSFITPAQSSSDSRHTCETHKTEMLEFRCLVSPFLPHCNLLPGDHTACFPGLRPRSLRVCLTPLRLTTTSSVSTHPLGSTFKQHPVPSCVVSPALPPARSDPHHVSLWFYDSFLASPPLCSCFPVSVCFSGEAGVDRP